MIKLAILQKDLPFYEQFIQRLYRKVVALEGNWKYAKLFMLSERLPYRMVINTEDCNAVYFQYLDDNQRVKNYAIIYTPIQSLKLEQGRQRAIV